MMNIISSALLGLIAITSAAAAANPKCVTYGEGTLTTSETTFPNGTFNGQFKPFAFNFRGELSFYHVTQHPTIHVQFQICLPNYSGNDNTYMDKAGRIYITATKNCLAVNNPDSKTGPYHVVAKSCPNSAAGEMGTAKSIPFNWVNSRGYIDWIGNSAHDGSRLQGGCPGGAWGFKADNTRTPITDKSGEYRVDLICLEKGQGGGTFWTH